MGVLTSDKSQTLLLDGPPILADDAVALASSIEGRGEEHAFDLAWLGKKPFHFRGHIAASKSLLNRVLIVKSFYSCIELIGESSCDDVKKMTEALALINTGKTQLDCGAAGTVFRFLALRVSRQPGRYLLKGHDRLLNRPQQELCEVLSQLGVSSQLGPDGLWITSDGWKVPPIVKIDVSRSSQFLSALVLSAWELPQSLTINIASQNFVSVGYWEMTRKLCEQMGMQIEVGYDEARGTQIVISAEQRCSFKGAYTVEYDMSSAFALAALAAIDGCVCFDEFPQDSLQPDADFVRLLKNMGAHVSRNSSQVIVSQGKLNGVAWDLQSCPDLFPVLAVLCGMADGSSVLTGISHLDYKESQRKKEIIQFLEKLGVGLSESRDKLTIHGRGQPYSLQQPLIFEPKSDHRLAMAAAVAAKAQVPLKLKNPQVVDKSFPEFWQILQKGHDL